MNANLLFKTFSPILALTLIVSAGQASAQPNALEVEQQQFLRSQTPVPDALEVQQQQFLQTQPPIRPQIQSEPIAVLKQPLSAPKTAFGDLEPNPPDPLPEPVPPTEPDPQPVPSAPEPQPTPKHSRTIPAPKPLPSLTSPQGYSRIVVLPAVQPMPQAPATPTPMTVVQPLVQKLALTLVPTFEPLFKGAESLLYPLVYPVAITSPFGWRVHPISGTTRFHAGIDLGAPLGSPVLAAFSGRVVSAGWYGGYGNAVVLEHNAGLRSLYAHLSQPLVSPSQFIAQGAVIGLSGSTGNSTGPHLHFETQHNLAGTWTAVDPGVPLKAAQNLLVSVQVQLGRQEQAIRRGSNLN